MSRHHVSRWHQLLENNRKTARNRNEGDIEPPYDQGTKDGHYIFCSVCRPLLAPARVLSTACEANERGSRHDGCARARRPSTSGIEFRQEAPRGCFSGAEVSGRSRRLARSQVASARGAPGSHSPAMIAPCSPRCESVLWTTGNADGLRMPVSVRAPHLAYLCLCCPRGAGQPACTRPRAALPVPASRRRTPGRLRSKINNIITITWSKVGPERCEWGFGGVFGGVGQGPGS